MNKALNFKSTDLIYKGIIGTGGIGSGKFFKLSGDHTLGREESRSGTFLNIDDYCKQHIILYYIKDLLGSSFSVIPSGKVGDDETGKKLLTEMISSGFKMDYVEMIPSSPTLFSFCFSYPDGTGGNLTTDNSASSLVDVIYIEKLRNDIQLLGSNGIIMAAPEVPLSARLKLLELGKDSHMFCTASFTSEELHSYSAHDLLKDVDLLAINMDEAAAIAGINPDKTSATSIPELAFHKLQTYSKEMLVSITAGKNGSWCRDEKKINFFPSIKAEVKSTAGAGDAFFAGLISGIAIGLSLFEAQQLATLVAGLSISSFHTINNEIDRITLLKFLDSSDLTFSGKIKKLLRN